MRKQSEEDQFKDHILSKLLESGYRQRHSNEFDLDRALDSKIFVEFIQTSQEKEWKEIQKQYGVEAEQVLLDNFEEEVDNRGIIDVLRKGYKISEIRLYCAYFKPVSSLDPTAQVEYENNILSVIREARVSSEDQRKIDFLLCLNGIPILSSEIKNLVTDQTFKDAEKQYKQTRDPSKKLLEFKKRTLVHFAVDQHDVSMTTKLAWEKTKFQPFNQGRNNGAGNPDNKPYRTSYLWEKIWQKDILLDIIKNFIHLQIEEPKEPHQQIKETLIFPRYHQLDSVTQLINATKKSRTGTNYLIQHSTGSGKSFTIAWLAFKLSSLHADKDPIFDSVLVISDRIGIVGQLKKIIKSFEQTSGVVEPIKKTSNLVELLQKDTKIMISTQQKFHNLLDKLGELYGKKFAIIIDEAHSSQGGDSATKVKQVLSLNENDSTEKEDFDQLINDIKSRGPQKNLSYFAFTATPRDKTLELFGKPGLDGKLEPFHVYSMNQAIQEGYILDVLKHIITVKRFFEVQKNIPDDKLVDGKKAKHAIMKFVDEHDLNVSEKAKVIVNHFSRHSASKILSQAKAMIVAGSRSQALTYKNKIDDYLKEIGRSDIKSLVAFSGSLQDPITHKIYTEANVNGVNTDEELRDKFNKQEYRFLIVADKYQTGYDQPLLHSMYVDKKINDIRAFQTLSRLNRKTDEKHDTFVMLFKNTEDEIEKAFERYYTYTELYDKTDQNFLNILYKKILEFNVITNQDIENFAKVWYKKPEDHSENDLDAFNEVIRTIQKAYEKLADVKQDEFRLKLRQLTNNYEFLTQIAEFKDANIQKLYVLAVYLLKFIKGNQPYDYEPEHGELSLKYVRLKQSKEASISIDNEPETITVHSQESKPKIPEVFARLSEIIQIINERHGEEFTEFDTITTEEWQKILQNMDELREIAKENDFDYFLNYFEKEFEKIISRSYDTNPTFVNRIFLSQKLREDMIKKAAELYYTWANENNLPPITRSTPAENRLNFRKTIERCKDYIQWIDRYFDIETLKFLMDGMDKSSVKVVKILSSLYQSGLDEKLYNEFKQFYDEMQKKKINCQFRIITNKDLHYDIHDRILEGSNTVYNIPSAAQVNLGQYSEIKKTQNRPPFDLWWSHEDNLDLVSDWNKIQQKIIESKTKKKYPAICDSCGKKIEVPFVPDVNRPIYCREHMPNRR